MGGVGLTPIQGPISSHSLIFFLGCLFLLLLNLLQEPLQVVRLLHEELDLLLPFLIFILPLLFDDTIDGLDFRPLLNDLFLLLLLLFLKLSLPILKLLSAMLSLQLFARCKCH